MANPRDVGATEMKLEPQEDLINQGSDDDTAGTSHANEEHDGEGSYTIEFESEEDVSKTFVPTIKIQWLGDDALVITTVVLKDLALTSDLFKVLEEENLDVVFENQYRTESRVAHTLQVKVKPGYNVDALEKKLSTWAGKPT